MSRIHVISDTHFNHEKVIGYENRPFANVEEMNERLIENWNSVVSKRDKVFHLGDFGWGNYEMNKLIRSRLRGHIIHIMGNHCKRRSRTWWLNVGMDEVIEYPIIYKRKLILSHEPVEIYSMNHLNVHGHIHSKNRDDPFHVNVSVEQINYTPVNLIQIMENFL